MCELLNYTVWSWLRPAWCAEHLREDFRVPEHMPPVMQLPSSHMLTSIAQSAMALGDVQAASVELGGGGGGCRGVYKVNGRRRHGHLTDERPKVASSANNGGVPELRLPALGGEGLVDPPVARGVRAAREVALGFGYLSHLLNRLAVYGVRSPLQASWAVRRVPT